MITYRTKGYHFEPQDAGAWNLINIPHAFWTEKLSTNNVPHIKIIFFGGSFRIKLEISQGSYRLTVR